MSAYDLEEQERIDALKDWWDKWGVWVYAAIGISPGTAEAALGNRSFGTRLPRSTRGECRSHPRENAEW